MDREYFSFELSTGIDLALPLTDMKVATQFEVTNICVVPGVADFWYGVTNFKGSLMWVLDSDRFFMQSLMGETPKTALHRFFNTVRSDRQPKKLTTVILHQQQAQKKVAIATRQLKGIISIWPDSFKPIENDTSILSKCCNAVVQTEALSTYIIESAALLQQLQKRSLLNAALKDISILLETPSDKGTACKGWQSPKRCSGRRDCAACSATHIAHGYTSPP